MLTKCKSIGKVCQLYISFLSGFRIPLSASPSTPAVEDHTIVTLTSVSEGRRWLLANRCSKKFLNH